MNRLNIALITLTASQAALAGGNGYSEPVLSAVPAMSPFGLTALAVLLAVVGVRILHNRR
jgi:hypothetical protein